jgi:hypothetical protein
MSISTPRVVNLGRIGFLCAAAIALSACVYRGPYNDGYYYDGYRGYYQGAYYDRDPCAYDDAYCGYPVYDGGIFVSGDWYGGRHRYRDHDGHREYWVRGGWHHGQIDGGHRHYYHRSY